MASTAHSSVLAHHFDTLEQQKQAASLGMWVFIAQEIMFFGGLFLGYTFYRYRFPEAFAAGSAELSIAWGGFNTVVLICSSLTMALAVHSAQLGKNKLVMSWLMATILLGAGFLGVKAIEYTAKWNHHLVPGQHFDYHPSGGKFIVAGAQHGGGGHATGGHGAAAAGSEAAHGKAASKQGGHDLLVPVNPNHVQIFYGFYFVMTGMHALHMVIGIGIMIWLIANAAKERFSPEYYNPVEMSGLYWHFVDIVWIFLFPLLYLIGRH